jgi:hypothetical protein
VDSFSLRAVDIAGNEGDENILYVLILPKLEMQIYIVPNPMEIIGNNVKDIYKSFDDEFNISAYNLGKQGSVLLLLFDRDIDVYNSKGRVKIFDAVGNTVTDYINVTFGYSSNNTPMGVCIWDGRNTNGRIVSPNSYLAYIEIYVTAKVFVDDGINEINTSYKKLIGVKYTQ